MPDSDSVPSLSHRDDRPTTVSGGDDRTRTDDLLVANQALYQLSYVPMDGVGVPRDEDNAVSIIRRW